MSPARDGSVCHDECLHEPASGRRRCRRQVVYGRPRAASLSARHRTCDKLRQGWRAGGP